MISTDVDGFSVGLSSTFVNGYNGGMSPRAAPAPASPRVRGCCRPVAAPLPDREAEDLAGAFRALADPTRVQILHILGAADEPVCVCDLTAAFDLGQPTI